MATPNLSITLPTVGGSTDTWGTTLNTGITVIDTVFGSSGTNVSMADVSVDQLTVIAQGDLRLADTTGGQYVAFQAHGTTTSYTLTMPAGVPSASDVLTASDGSGTLSWAAPTTGDITGITAGTGLSGTDLSGPVPTLNVDASQTQITSVGALGAGSISSGFGAIDVGSSSIDGGTITGTFAGNITGNVTGNTSGTAATVTGAAQSAITSVGTLTSLGVGAITASRQLFINGSADEVQLLVQGNSSQANELVVFETSAGTNKLEFTNAGNLMLIGGTFQMANNTVFKMLDSGGTARDIVALSGANVITIGNESLDTKVTAALTVVGTVTLTGLPTSEPATTGALWNDSGTIKIKEA